MSGIFGSEFLLHDNQTFQSSTLADWNNANWCFDF